MATIPFLKSLFLDENTRKRRKLCTPLKTWLIKILWSRYFHREMTGTNDWPNQVDQLLTLKRPRCGPIVYTIYIYIWPRPRFLPTFSSKNCLKLGKKCTFRPKKARPILVFLFVSSLFPFLPQMAKMCCSCLAKSQKRRQKTRPPPYIFIDLLFFYFGWAVVWAKHGDWWVGDDFPARPNLGAQAVFYEIT